MSNSLLKVTGRKAVRDNRQRCHSGSNLDIAAECAVVNLLVIYTAFHNCRFPHSLDRCTVTVSVHPVSDFMVPVIRQVKILLMLLVSRVKKIVVSNIGHVLIRRDNSFSDFSGV